MDSTRATHVLIVALIGLLTLISCPVRQAEAQSYTVTDLGVLPGMTESYALAVNNAGQVAG
jgi:hypothetical protein